MSGRLLPAVLAALALGACQQPVTELVVVVPSDLVAPDEIDEIRIAATGASDTSDAPFAHASLAKRDDLPITVGLLGTGAARVEVVVTGRRAGADVLTRRAKTAFVGGETRTLVVPLVARCLGVVCGGATEVCGDSGCAAADVAPAALAPWTGKPPSWQRPGGFVHAVWLDKLDEAALDEIKAAGFETVLFDGRTTGALDALAARGLRGVPEVYAFSKERCAPDADATMVTSAARPLARHPALFAWGMGLGHQPELCIKDDKKDLMDALALVAPLDPGRQTIAGVDATNFMLTPLRDDVDVLVLDLPCGANGCDPFLFEQLVAAAQGRDPLRRYWIAIRNASSDGKPALTNDQLRDVFDRLARRSRLEGYVVLGWQTDPPQPDRAKIYRDANALFR
jgi:hypothetical protein